MDKYLQHLPISVQQKSLRSVNESAWAAQEALQVIDHLDAQEVAILGGEVWLPGPTHPFPFVYGWDVRSKRENESWSQFMQRASQLAKEYVSTFEWDEEDITHHGLIPYFNFTFCQADEYKEL